MFVVTAVCRLMDLFHHCCVTNTALEDGGGGVGSGSGIKRVHFNKFMINVHQRLHLIRGTGHEGDPIPNLAPGP